MRTVRRLAIVFVLLAILTGVVAFLLPRFINAGLGHGMIQSRLGGFVSGGADFASVETSWSGEQRISGLVLTADDGITRVDVDVVVRHGLLELLGGLPPTLEASISGTAKGRIDEQGQPSFLRLPARGAGEGGGGGGGAGGSGAGSSGGDGARLPFGLQLDVTALEVELDLAGPDGDRPLRFAGLDGEILVAAGAPLEVRLASPTTFEGTDGDVAIDVSIGGLVAADGRVTPLTATIGSARVTARGLPLPAAGETVMVEQFQLTASGDPAGRLEASVNASARVADSAVVSQFVADVRIDELVRNGTVDVDGAAWTLDVRGDDVPTGPLAAFVPALAEAGVDLAQDVGTAVRLRAIAGSAAGSPFTLELRGDAATLVAGGATGDDRTIAIDDLTIDATVRPALVARHAPITLDRPLPVRVTSGPFTLDPAALAAGTLPSVQLTATSQATAPFVVGLPADEGADGGRVTVGRLQAVLLPELTLQATGAGAGADVSRSATVQLDGVRIEHPSIALPLDAAVLSLEATRRTAAGGGGPARTEARVLPSVLTAAGAPIGTLAATYSVDDASPDEPAQIDATLTGAAPAAIEALLAIDAGTIGGWTRGDGDVRVALRPGDTNDLAMILAFPGVAGDLGLRQAGDRLDVRSAALTLRPSPERLAALTGGPAAAADTDRLPLRITGDVELVTTVDIAGLSLAALQAGGPDLVATILGTVERLDVGATTTPLTLVAAGTPAPLPALATRVQTARGGPIGITIRDPAAEGDAADAAAPAPGSAAGSGATTLLVDVRILELLRDGMIDAAGARLDGTARLAAAPAALLDTLFGTGDLVASTLGSRVDASLAADGFGRDAGTVVLGAAGPYGRVDATVRGEHGAFVIDEAAPLVATLDLHPVLRDRVLSKIQPIFGGVSATDGPLTLTVTSAIVPLSDGISAATADFRAEAGALSMQPSFGFLSLIALFDGGATDPAGGGQPLLARIEPITGRLSSGRITTQATRLVFNKGASIDFAAGSSVDLETRSLNVRASMPLKWLGSVFREAQGLADSVTVPLIARGPAGTAQLRVDPSFDVGRALLEAGVGGLIDRELERAVPGLGDLLRGLGGGRTSGGG
jgi:hypothetical protein